MKWNPKRLALRLLRILLVVYLGMMLGCSWAQDWLIFPGHARQGEPSTKVISRSWVDVVDLKVSTGDTVRALYVPASPANTDGSTILLFYGNGNCAADMFDVVQTFHERGFNVMVPDFIGYGMSTGEPSEANCYETANLAYDYLTRQRHVPPNKLIVGGWSLGAAVATDLAWRKQTAALMTFCAFTTMPDIAQKVIPFLPVRFFVRYRFDNLAKFPQIKCPIFCAHGLDDSFIPCQMTQALADSVGVKPLLVKGANHNDFFEKSTDILPEQLDDFFLKHELLPKIPS